MTETTTKKTLSCREGGQHDKKFRGVKKIGWALVCQQRAGDHSRSQRRHRARKWK